MKNSIQNQVVEVVFSNAIDYFANSITSTEIIEILRPLTEVSEEQEQKISDILDLTQQEWDNADADAEGATKEQDCDLDRIIEDAAFSIAELLF